MGIHPPGLLTPLLRARCAQVTYCSINDGKSMVAFVEARENAMTGDYENQVGWKESRNSMLRRTTLVDRLPPP